MPLDRLIDLLAEAAVRKLSQEREAEDTTPGAMALIYTALHRQARGIATRRKGFTYA